MSQIVALGASAGGLNPLEKFFSSLPDEPGCSFVIVQHLSPDFKSLMPQLMQNYTNLPISEVRDGMQPEKNKIYLIPSDRVMTLVDGVFRLSPRSPDRLAINEFFISMAAECGTDCAGIILSGTGSDGTKGCAEIRKAGGLVLAQEPESAEFSSMPEAVIRGKLAHDSAQPAALWSCIERHRNNPKLRDSEAPPGTSLIQFEERDSSYNELYAFLNKELDLDFSCYKLTSVSRRIQRRMGQLGIHAVPDYLDHLRKEAEEVHALYRDLLIGVTAFYRDAEYFSLLSRNVIEPLILEAPEDLPLRIWVAGCATGEEAYTLAMCIKEASIALDKDVPFTIFATDIHKRSVDRAGVGEYPAEAVASLGGERTTRFFKETSTGNFKIESGLRRHVVFAQHNLLVDPPFTRMDLVTCRNLLIYLKTETQEHILHSFHYSLRSGGSLMLGASESLGRLEKDFEVLSKRGKIYRKSGKTSGFKPQHLHAAPAPAAKNDAYHAPTSSRISIEKSLLNAYDLLLNEHAPASLLIDSNRQVKHLFPKASAYCSIPEGRVENDILNMLTGDLRLATSTAIQRAISGHTTDRAEGVTFIARTGEEVVDVKVQPFLSDLHGTDLLLVSFLPRRKLPEAAPSQTDDAGKSFTLNEQAEFRIQMLEDELRTTKENLQATIEELQTSNEELQATNEEVQVSNEELQSTNEELHSMNEELHTVNAELEERNSQLNQLNEDHENLLSSIEDGVLYVDRNLRIRKFNPAIAVAFNLLPQDVGRPLDHISFNLENPEQMMRDVHQVLLTGTRIERESRTDQGKVYMRRFSPFLNDNSETEGVILSFTDVTQIEQMRLRLSRAMRTARMVWWEWDLPSDMLKVHSDVNCILGYESDHLTHSGEYWFSRLHPDEVDRIRATIQDCLDGRKQSWSSEHRYKTVDGAWEWVQEFGYVSGRDKTGKPVELSGTTANIHQRKMMELDLRASKEAAEKAAMAKSRFLSTMSHEIRTPLNGVIGMADLLRMSELNKEQREQLETIIQSGNVLLDVLNSILDFSKAESGKLEINREPCHLLPSLESTLKGLSLRAQQRRISMETDLRLEDTTYHVDFFRLRQVILNLVGNAIKFSEPGGRIHLSAREEKPGRIVIAVKDNGIGIRREDMDKLFQPFSQVDDSITRKYDGSGLGLSICREIIESMGGDISAKSEFGKGSVFTFSLQAEKLEGRIPLESAASEPVGGGGGCDPESKAVIIDDDPNNARVLQMMLHKLGHQATRCTSAVEGIECLRTERYDLVFLDLHMPEHSGFDIARMCRDNPDWASARSPLIAFTADVSAETEDEVVKNGFSGLLTKPVSIKALSVEINKLVFPKTGAND